MANTGCDIRPTEAEELPSGIVSTNKLCSYNRSLATTVTTTTIANKATTGSGDGGCGYGCRAMSVVVMVVVDVEIMIALRWCNIFSSPLYSLSSYDHNHHHYGPTLPLKDNYYFIPRVLYRSPQPPSTNNI